MNKLNQKNCVIENELCKEIAKELLPKLEKLNFNLKSINLEINNDNLLKLKLTKKIIPLENF
ncbi:hypothetical protein [Candidatus Cetobacterium colombiensis]|uniref:Uncharacterized protein n=1 Tax=Candidatus Cetobacterium colombiensis TaxID=3073100 RepID=A0ABU4WBP6_9FUSO|nr:hypothetical protein [Candidatus Cetobacterium colombiensis]MDX8336099.1 hypothetical protein [Candidatus Cetobacterium colombiensis]